MNLGTSSQPQPPQQRLRDTPPHSPTQALHSESSPVLQLCDLDFGRFPIRCEYKHLVCSPVYRNWMKFCETQVGTANDRDTLCYEESCQRQRTTICIYGFLSKADSPGEQSLLEIFLSGRATKRSSHEIEREKHERVFEIEEPHLADDGFAYAYADAENQDEAVLALDAKLRLK
ncbi:hypothetical protein Tco_1210338 [Tanacetum coccineum]